MAAMLDFQDGRQKKQVFTNILASRWNTIKILVSNQSCICRVKENLRMVAILDLQDECHIKTCFYHYLRF